MLALIVIVTLLQVRVFSGNLKSSGVGLGLFGGHICVGWPYAVKHPIVHVRGIWPKSRC